MIRSSSPSVRARSPQPGALLTLAASLAGAEARAQSVDPYTLVAAHAVHDEAVAALDAGDYASACPKLREVVRMVPEGIGAQLSLAECYEGEGKLASAWRTYAPVEVAARGLGQTARADMARDRRVALEPRLARLRIVIPQEVAALRDLVVLQDGEPVEAALWGARVPIDRGEHVVTVKASGKRPWELRFEIPKDGVEATLDVGSLVDAATEPEAEPRRWVVGSPSAAPRPAARPSAPRVSERAPRAPRAPEDRSPRGIGVRGRF